MSEINIPDDKQLINIVDDEGRIEFQTVADITISASEDILLEANDEIQIVDDNDDILVAQSSDIVIAGNTLSILDGTIVGVGGGGPVYWSDIIGKPVFDNGVIGDVVTRPLVPTDFDVGTVVRDLLEKAKIERADLENEIIDETKFAASIEPVKIVTALPNPVGYTGSKVVFFEGHLYRYLDGAWTLAVPAGEVVGQIVANQIADAAIEAAKLKDGALEAIKFADGVIPVERVTSLPVTGNFLGRQVFLTTDNKNYRWTGTAWTTATDASDVIGEILATQIAAGAVDTAELAAGAVVASKLADAAVTTDKLFSGAVTGDKIDALAVTSAKLADGAVTALKMLDGAVEIAKFASGLKPIEIVGALPGSGNTQGRTVFLTTDNKLYRWNGTAWTKATDAGDVAGQMLGPQIADLAITSGKIADAAVLTAKIKAGAVTSAELGINAVIAAKIADGAVTGTKILDLSVSTAKIADAAIAVAKLADGAVIAAKISDGAVTATKLLDGAVGLTKFASGITPVEVLGTLPVSGNFTGRTVALTTDGKLYRYNGSAFVSTTAASDVTGQLATAQIADDAINAAKVAAGAIDTAELAANAVTSAKIADATIGATKFSSTITPPGIGAVLPTAAGYTGPPLFFLTTDQKLYRYSAGAWTVAVSTADLAGTIGTAQIADNAVTTAKIINDAVDAAKIASGAVDAAELASNAVIAAKIADGAVTTAKILDAALTTAKFASGLTPVEVVGTLPVSGNTAGRTVFLTTDNKLYRYNGTSFVSTTAAADVTGQLGTTQIADDAINTLKIADDAINAAKIAAGAVDSSEIASNAVIAAKIADGAVTAAKILDASINVAKFASTIKPIEVVGTLPVSGNTAGRTVFLTTDSKLYRYNGTAFVSTTAATDLTGQITTTQITDNAITTVKVAANAITASQVAADTLTAGQIAAGAISTAELAAGAVNASKIAAGTITANEIAAGVITADLIAVGVNDNLIPGGGDFEQGLNGWTAIKSGALAVVPYQEATTAANAVNGTGYVVLNKGSSVSDANGCYILSQPFPVEPSEQYELSFWIKGSAVSASGQFCRILWYLGDGTTSASPPATLADKATTTEFVNKLGTLTAPGNARVARVQIFNWSASTSQYVYVDSIRVRRTAGATLIQDGAITTDKLVANSVTAAKIAAATITATEIAAATITGSNIAATTVTAGNLVADTITAGQIAAGAIATSELAALAVTAAKIAAGTITANEIAAGTITANEIAGTTITGNKLVAKTITAAQIAAGTITATEIASTTITAAQIAAATITGAKIAANTIAAGNIVADTLTAGEIAAGAISTAELAAGAVTAAKIAAGTITADLIAVGVQDNLIPGGGDFEASLMGWTAGASGANAVTPTWQNIASNAYNGTGSVVLNKGTAVSDSNTTNVYSPAFAVEEGEVYEVSGWFKGSAASATGCTLVVLWYTSAMGSITQNNTTINLTTAFAQTVGSVTAPATARFARVQFLNAGTSVSQYMYADAIRFRRAGGATLIKDGAITTNKIAANAITATHLSAGIITADLLAVGTAENLIPGGGDFELNLGLWAPSKTGASSVLPYWENTTAANAQNGSGYAVLNKGTAVSDTNGAQLTSGQFPVEGGEQYEFSLWVKGSAVSAANQYSRLYWYTSTGAAASTVFSDMGAVNVTTSFVQKIQTFTAPADAKFARAVIFNWSASTSQYVYVDSVRVRRTVGVTLIQDGVITTNKIGANQITAAKIAANTITANEIFGDTITAAQIAAGAIATSELATDAVTAVKIAAGQITADKIAIGTITENMIPGGGEFEGGNLGGWALNGSTGGGVISAGSTASKAYSGGGYLLIDKNGTTTGSGSGALSQASPVEAAAQYEVGGWFTGDGTASVGGFYFRVLWYNNAGTNFTNTDIVTANSAFPATWTRYSSLVTAPAGAVNARILVLNSTASVSRYLYADVITFRKAVQTTLIADGVITTAKVAALAIDAGKIAADTITAGQIAAGAIATSELAALAVTAAKIAANTITANKIAAGTITATQIAANTITANKMIMSDFTNLAENPNFASGDVSWTKVLTTITSDPANAYTGNYVAVISPGASRWALTNLNVLPVTPGDKFYVKGAAKAGASAAGSNLELRIRWYDAAMTGSTYALGATWTPADSSYVVRGSEVTVPAGAVYATITVAVASTLTGDSYYFGYMAVNRRNTAELIVDGSIIASKIATDAVEAGKIKAGAINATNLIVDGIITTPKMVISDFTNLVENPSFAVGNIAWGVYGGTTITADAVNTFGGGWVATIPASANGNKLESGNIFPVTPGDKFYVFAAAKASSTPNQSVILKMRFLNADKTTTTSYTICASWTSADTTYSIKGGEATAPAGAAWATAVIALDTTMTGGTYYIGLVGINRKANANLIVDGAITAAKIGAGEVIAGKLAVGSIDNAVLIVDGTITAAKVATDTLTAGQINAGAITASEIASNAVTTVKLAAGAITADKIAIGTVNESLVMNGDFENGVVGWSTGTEFAGLGVAPATSSATSAYEISGSNYLVLDKGSTSTTTDKTSAISDFFPVEPSERYELSGWLAVSTGVSAGIYFRVYWYTNAQSAISTSTVISNGACTTTMTRYAGALQAPATAAYGRVEIINWTGHASRYLYADAVKVRKVSGTTMIADGAITTAKLVASSITADKLAVGFADNLVPGGGDFEDGIAWGGAVAGSGVLPALNTTAANVASGAAALVLNRGSTVAGTHGSWANSGYFTVEPNETYEVSYYIRGSQASAADIYARINWYQANYSAASTAYTETNTGSAVTTTLTKKSMQVTAPANAYRANLGFFNYLNSTTQYVYIDLVKVRKTSGTTLIQDGAIITAKIAAGSITADKVAIGTIGENIVPGGEFENANHGWTITDVVGSGNVISQATATPAYAASGTGYLVLDKKVTTSGNGLSAWSPLFPVESSEYYEVSCFAAASAASTAGFYLRVWWYTAAGAAASTATTDVFSNTALTTSLVKKILTTSTQAPANATQARLAVYNYTGSTARYFYIDSAKMRKVSGTTMIADGAITTSKIVAASITGDRIAATTISATNMIMSDFTNLVENPHFGEGDVSWTKTSGATIVNDPANANSGNWVMKITAPAASIAARTSAVIPVLVGDKFRVTVIAKAIGTPNTSLACRVRFMTADKATLVSAATAATIPTSVGTTYTTYVAEVVVPASAVYAWVDFFPTATMSAGTYCIGFVGLSRKANASLIVDGDITSAKLSAGAVTAGKIDVGGVSGSTQIANGVIVTSHIVAGAITADKIAIGAVGDSLVLGGDFEGGMNGWTTHSVTGSGVAPYQETTNPAYAASGVGYVVLNRGSTVYGTHSSTVLSPMFQAEAGTTYEIACFVTGAGTSGAGGLEVGVIWNDNTGGYINYSQAIPDGAIPATIAERKGTVTAPANTKYGYAYFRNSTMSTVQYMTIDKATVRKQAGTTLIADGAITTNKIVANSITAAKIAAGTITANEIFGDTLTAGQIAAGAIGASEIASSAITTAKLAAGAIAAEKIAAGAITAEKIAADAIFAVNIVADTITVNKIFTDSIRNIQQVKNLAFFSTVGITNWTIPANVTQIRLRMWGAGGGGAYSVGSNSASPGGGGGGYSEKTITGLTPGDYLQIVIGGGGTGGYSGGAATAGGLTAVYNSAGTVTHLGAVGGGLGVAVSSGALAAGGNGGTITNNGVDIALTGGQGQVGGYLGNQTIPVGGNGGSCPFGGVGGIGTSGTPGTGVFPGGGGGGSPINGSPGGSGARGQVLIEY